MSAPKNVLSAHPAVAAVDEQIADLDAASQARAQAAASASAKFQAEVADWQAARRAAQLAGKADPPAPEEPDVAYDPGLFYVEKRRLLDVRRQVIADAAGELEAQIADAQAGILREADKHVRQAVKGYEQMRALVDCAREVRTAVGRASAAGTPHPDAMQLPPQLGELDFLSAVLHDDPPISALRPVVPDGRRRTAAPVDVQTVRTGEYGERHRAAFAGRSWAPNTRGRPPRR